jgi:hypothetical protein
MEWVHVEEAKLEMDCVQSAVNVAAYMATAVLLKYIVDRLQLLLRI